MTWIKKKTQTFRTTKIILLCDSHIKQTKELWITKQTPVMKTKDSYIHFNSYFIAKCSSTYYIQSAFVTKHKNNFFVNDFTNFTIKTYLIIYTGFIHEYDL